MRTHERAASCSRCRCPDPRSGISRAMPHVSRTSMCPVGYVPSTGRALTGKRIALGRQEGWRVTRCIGGPCAVTGASYGRPCRCRPTVSCTQTCDGDPPPAQRPDCRNVALHDHLPLLAVRVGRGQAMPSIASDARRSVFDARPSAAKKHACSTVFTATGRVRPRAAIGSSHRSPRHRKLLVPRCQSPERFDAAASDQSSSGPYGAFRSKRCTDGAAGDPARRARSSNGRNW